MGDQRPRALKYQRNADALCKSARNLQPVGLHIGNGRAGQPRHLARMRRQHERACPWRAWPADRLGGENVERVGIDHRGHFSGREQAGGELDRLRALAQAGANGQHGVARYELGKNFRGKVLRGDSPAGVAGAAGSSAPAQGGYLRQRRRGNGGRHQAGAGAQGRK